MTSEVPTSHGRATEDFRLATPLERALHAFDTHLERSHAIDAALTDHTNQPRTTLLLVATPREGTATLGPLSTDWATVTDIVRDGADHLHLNGWLATNTARQHRDYQQAADLLDERTTP